MENWAEKMTAEQLQRIETLQLRNEILMWGTVIWAVLLLGWVVFHGAKIYLDMRNSILATGRDLEFQCESCGTRFPVPAAGKAVAAHLPVFLAGASLLCVAMVVFRRVVCLVLA